VTDRRRRLLGHSWAQLLLVLVVVVLGARASTRTFARLDLTADQRYSLDLSTRQIMGRLERPLIARVYFTRGLQAPYNNHEQLLVDRLEDLRAYSRGLMAVEVQDPTFRKELEDEARRFGIEPIQYRYQSAAVTEMRQVYMGLALVYGDREEVIGAVTNTDTLEYELARAVKKLVVDEEPRVIGWSTGHGEPDLATGTGPLEALRNRLGEDGPLASVPLGGAGLIPDEVDALFVVGPQKPLSERALWQLDQFLMRGGALAVFLSNTRPDLRTLRPVSVYHGLDLLMGHYGVQVNRDVVVDRTQNGVMRFPARQGRSIVQLPVNYPLIPRATVLNPESPVTRGLDSMLFPFTSSLMVAEALAPEVSASVLVSSSAASGRIRGVRTIDPTAYKVVAPGEERGSFPLVVALTGAWPSWFADREIPAPPAESGGAAEDPATRLRTGAPTRLVVSGSADMVANNLPFVLNLADWLVQDESLIAIRSKVVKLPTLAPQDEGSTTLLKLANLLGGPLLLLLVGGVRWWLRRAGGRGPADREAAA
jgi:gliding-associated putative ABC transporter substrate-binding component GldG